MPARRTRDDRGTAVVEFALVVPFLILLLFGITTTGLTYSDHLAITNAVREGARFGSAVDYTDPNWASDIQKRVGDVYFNSGSSLTTANVCIKLISQTSGELITAGTSCGTEPTFATADIPAAGCIVKVWVVKSAKIETIIGPTMNFNIGASSVSYYGRQVGSCQAK